MRRGPFESFLVTRCRGPRTGAPLGEPTARSYASKLAKVEDLLRKDADMLDLSAGGLVGVESALRSAGVRARTPAGTLNDCVSALRAYAQFQAA